VIGGERGKKARLTPKETPSRPGKGRGAQCILAQPWGTAYAKQKGKELGRERKEVRLKHVFKEKVITRKRRK